MKNNAADSKIGSHKKSILEPIGLTSPPYSLGAKLPLDFHQISLFEEEMYNHIMINTNSLEIRIYLLSTYWYLAFRKYFAKFFLKVTSPIAA